MKLGLVLISLALGFGVWWVLIMGLAGSGSESLKTAAFWLSWWTFIGWGLWFAFSSVIFVLLNYSLSKRTRN
jgi:hypothetical protein